MLIAAVAVTPIAGWAVLPALTDPTAILAGIGVVVLAQLPSALEVLGVALVVAGVALNESSDGHGEQLHAADPEQAEGVLVEA